MKTEGLPLESVLSLLGAAYRDWKIWEEAKNLYKTQFFAHADQVLVERGLAMKSVMIATADPAVAKTRAELHNPGWVILTIRPSEWIPDTFEVLLEEDPTVKAFSFVHDGIKYARTVSKGAAMIDDEWLAEAEPELYEAVTYTLPWGTRITVPLEQLSLTAIGQLTPYIYSMPPRVSLAAPRPVKEDE